MGAPLSVVLGGDPAPVQIEPWTSPDLLGHARAEESVDLQSICSFATDILFRLSGCRFGVRTETVRPVAGQHQFGWGSLNTGISYANVADWSGAYQANAGAPDYVLLKSPVQAISAVTIDGHTLDPSTYQLYDNRRLVRVQSTTVGNSLCWPIYQRLEVPLTDVGSFGITYSWGTPVPAGGRIAAQMFALELAKYINKEPSALPDRTMSVSRQGVTISVDTSPLLKNGTGLFACDAWIKSVNPSGNRRRPTITNPDTVRLVRPT